MSRIAIPIAGQVLWSTGDIRLSADIDLLLKDSSGNLISDSFRLDTGTEITTFFAYHAMFLGLPMAANASSGVTHTQTGLEIRSGILRFRIVGMDQTEYATPCLFLGDPSVAPAPNRPATFPRKLLQPFALLNHLRFGIAKDPGVGSLYGDLVIESK
jgi:hypothetical protein